MRTSPTRSTTPSLLLLLLLLAVGLDAGGSAGCTSTVDEVVPDEVVGTSGAVVLSREDVARVLAVASYPGNTADILERLGGLDARAAQAIASARAGADGRSPSDDDEVFLELDALDSVPYVGDAVFVKLLDLGRRHPPPEAHVVDGVTLSGWQCEAILWAVNRVDAPVLDRLLDARAARTVLATRPYGDVDALGAVAYVGAAAITRLRDEAGAWWIAMHAAAPVQAFGTFDAVTFDEATARVALEIANCASVDQLVAHGVYLAGATRIVTRRPYASLAEVAALSGIATASMHALRSYASSGAWIGPGAVLLDAALLTRSTRELQEALRHDEAFVAFVRILAGSDEHLTATILSALDREIERLAAPLLGTRYEDDRGALSAVVAATPVKDRVRAGGWTYLRSLGVVR